MSHVSLSASVPANLVTSLKGANGSLVFVWCAIMNCLEILRTELANGE